MRITSFALLMLFVAPILAQGTADMESKYQEKLKKEFISKVTWEMKLDDAMAKAREQKKLIIGYFTRSYAQ